MMERGRKPLQGSQLEPEDTYREVTAVQTACPLLITIQPLYYFSRGGNVRCLSRTLVSDKALQRWHIVANAVQPCFEAPSGAQHNATRNTMCVRRRTRAACAVNDHLSRDPRIWRDSVPVHVARMGWETVTRTIDFSSGKFNMLESLKQSRNSTVCLFFNTGVLNFFEFPCRLIIN